MLEKIIYASIRHRWLVMFAVIGFMALGVYNFNRLSIDAVPDITNVQVQINTEAAGYSPLEVEQRVTFPIETVLACEINIGAIFKHYSDLAEAIAGE